MSGDIPLHIKDAVPKNPNKAIAWNQTYKGDEDKLHVVVPDDAVLVCPTCFANARPKCAYTFATYGQHHGPVCKQGREYQMGSNRLALSRAKNVRIYVHVPTPTNRQLSDSTTRSIIHELSVTNSNGKPTNCCFSCPQKHRMMRKTRWILQSIL